MFDRLSTKYQSFYQQQTKNYLFMLNGRHIFAVLYFE